MMYVLGSDIEFFYEVATCEGACVNVSFKLRYVQPRNESNEM